MAVIKVTSDSMVYILTTKCTFRFEAILKVALNQCKVTVGYISNSKAINIISRCARCIFRNELLFFLWCRFSEMNTLRQ